MEWLTSFARVGWTLTIPQLPLGGFEKSLAQVEII